MSSGDSLGDRMKGYEEASRTHLTKRMPTIIRVDGKAFHTLTRGMNRPWDDGMLAAMLATTEHLCRSIQGAKLGYVQSDEISILITDYDRLNTSAWFDKGVQKMVSVSAAMATRVFNKEMRKYYPEKEGEFDSRVFVIPKEEVCNYFLWRQQDASRNSVQMLGRSHFSHKALNNKSCSAIQDMLMTLKPPVNWNDIPTHKKRGAAVRRNKADGNWVVDLDMPILSQDREYVNALLLQEEV